MNLEDMGGRADEDLSLAEAHWKLALSTLYSILDAHLALSKAQQIGGRQTISKVSKVQ